MYRGKKLHTSEHSVTCDDIYNANPVEVTFLKIEPGKEKYDSASVFVKN